MGGVWDIQTLGNGRAAALELDRAGHPHVAYTAGADSLRYAWHDGQSWHDETILALGGSSLHGYAALQSFALALGPQDDPHISYTLAEPQESGGDSYRLGYAQRANGLWVPAAEVTLQGGPAAVALAVDAAGYPHISYQDGSALKYRRWAGSAWVVQGVESATPGQVDAWQAIVLALDPHSVPHIGYVRAVPQMPGDDARQEMALRHVALREAIWAAETVDQTVDTGLRSALALDFAGSPHISYRDRHGALRYATWTSSHWGQRNRG